jgi:hypothetical protein
MRCVPAHKTIRRRLHIYVNGNTHTNTIESTFSVLKRGVMGTRHRLSAKHLQAYLREMTFCPNPRNISHLFVDTLRHMVRAFVITFERLTA